jgi:hypothetical protein
VDASHAKLLCLTHDGNLLWMTQLPFGNPHSAMHLSCELARRAISGHNVNRMITNHVSLILMGQTQSAMRARACPRHGGYVPAS